ncbi:hypothetical protein ACMFMG_009449 [Clarireedia jacksonii]
MSNFNQYLYEPLVAADAVRVIILEPAVAKESPLLCSIIQQRRSAPNVEYSAVSYTWGEPDYSKTLEIRYGNKTSHLRITPNVDALLRVFRAYKEKSYFWIDAVCLNQDDAAEKAQQIPFMGHIYAQARSVHIWVGPENHMTSKLFRFFRKLSRFPEERGWNMAGRIVSLAKKTLHDDTKKKDQVFICPGIFSVYDFFDRSWFSRRWVIQEAWLAREATVHCGRLSIPLRLLASAASHIQTLDISSYSVKMIASMHKRKATSSILELLWSFHEAACLEPKDRITAFFGLVSGDSLFSLDYSLHWTKLYRELTEFSFINGDNDTRLQLLLHLFEFGPVSLPDDASYPSWVPDWSKSRQRHLPYHSRTRSVDTYEKYEISPGISEKASVSFQDGALHIHGHSSISESGARRVTYARTFNSSPQTKDCMAEMILEILKDLFPSSTKSPLQLFEFCSMLEMINGFRYSENDQKRNSMSDVSLNRYIDKIIKETPKHLNSKTFTSLRQLYSILQEFCLFELTPFNSGLKARHYYGIGPFQIQVDDAIIPVWRLKWSKQSFTDSHDSWKAGMHLMGVIAVRPISEGSLQYDTVVLDANGQPCTGRIIGPGICVLTSSE